MMMVDDGGVDNDGHDDADKTAITFALLCTCTNSLCNILSTLVYLLE